MKFALIIVAFMCLAQNTARGHDIAKRATNPAQAAAENAIATVVKLAQQVIPVIVEGNRLLHEYSDNSTFYAGYFAINIVEEINLAQSMVNNSFALASATINSPNANVLACLTAEQNRIQLLILHLVGEVIKCGITKIRQFVDLPIKLALLANNTVHLVALTIERIQNCSNEPDDIYKYGCIAWQLSRAVPTLLQIPVTVSVTVATGTALYATIQADLIFCAQAKLFSFRRRMIEIPLTIGVCTAKSIIKLVG